MYDTGTDGGIQRSGMTNNLLKILNSKVSRVIVLLSWRLGHSRYVSMSVTLSCCCSLDLNHGLFRVKRAARCWIIFKFVYTCVVPRWLSNIQWMVVVVCIDGL